MAKKVEQKPETKGARERRLMRERRAERLKKEHKSNETSVRCKFITGTIVLLLIAVSLTFMIMFMQCNRVLEPLKLKVKQVEDRLRKDLGNDKAVRKMFIDNVDARQIRENLRNISYRPHLAGTEGNIRTAKYIKNMWKSYGLEVKTSMYDVLLSYPDPHEPNKIILLNGTGGVILESPLREKALRPEGNDTDIVQPFNAYSSSGKVEGDLVYANYGRLEDFITLNATVPVKGKIVIVRYGRIFRGNKAHFAEMFGAIGLIIYSDPEKYGPPNNMTAYPDSEYLPATGVQRGTVKMIDGDPLTYGYPANEFAYRSKEKDAHLPTIPVQPVGYGFAQELLGNMTGENAPKDWQGRLNIIYKLGPGFQNTNWTVKMDINTKNERKTIQNVFGIIKGIVEPDRYVLVGNHRDAWVFGAADPSGGTAVMLELSRVMGNLYKKENWRPRRTIIFCSWDAEEYGLVGSTEWVEQYIKNIQSRVVAYLNIDIPVSGHYELRVRGVPLLSNAAYAAAAKVPNPDVSEVKVGRDDVYETWLYTSNKKKGLSGEDLKSGLPRIEVPGSGSDFATFLVAAGVSVADLRYIAKKVHTGGHVHVIVGETWLLGRAFHHFMPCDLDYEFLEDSNPNLLNTAAKRVNSESALISTLLPGGDPLYHSAYESFYLIDQFLDPGFKYHKAVGQVWIEMARNLADSPLLPSDVVDYAIALSEYADSFMALNAGLFHERNVSTDWLYDLISNFTTDASDFMDRIEDIDMKDELVLRRFNDRIMQLERAFLNPSGIPGHPNRRHIIFAQSDNNAYEGSSFPGLSSAIAAYNETLTDEAWDIVEQQYALLLFSIQSASSVLKVVDEFWL